MGTFNSTGSMDAGSACDNFGYEYMLRDILGPYFYHNGNTGAVYLNDPANGDVTFGGDFATR